MAVIIGMSGDVKSKSFFIKEGEDLTLGRSSDNAVQISNAAVSSHHCLITKEGGRFLLRDLDSTNGTRVNNKDVKEITLKPKDLIQIGNAEFLFSAEGISFEEAEAVSKRAEVVEASGPAAKPESFTSISPFGARQKEAPGLWMMLIIIFGIAAIAVVAYFFYKLFAG